LVSGVVARGEDGAALVVRAAARGIERASQDLAVGEVAHGTRHVAGRGEVVPPRYDVDVRGRLAAREAERVGRRAVTVGGRALLPDDGHDVVFEGGVVRARRVDVRIESRVTRHDVRAVLARLRRGRRDGVVLVGAALDPALQRVVAGARQPHRAHARVLDVGPDGDARAVV